MLGGVIDGLYYLQDTQVVAFERYLHKYFWRDFILGELWQFVVKIVNRYLEDYMKIEERYLRIHSDIEDSFLNDEDNIKIVWR